MVCVEPKVHREETVRLAASKLDHKFSLVAVSHHWPLRRRTAHYRLILSLCSPATKRSYTPELKHIYREMKELDVNKEAKPEGRNDKAGC